VGLEQAYQRGRAQRAKATVVFNDRVHEPTAGRLEAESHTDARALPRISSNHPERNKFNAFFFDGIETCDWVVLIDIDTAVCADLDQLY